jgi:uncharacterized protein YndB with AHSA1/START domain
MTHTEPTATSVEIDAPQSAVFAAIVDADTYPDWLVGARRIRHIEPEWPERGGRFHHTIGFGPVRLDDVTQSLEVDAPHLLRLRAGMGPLGAALVTFRVTGTADATVLTIDEGPDEGPFRFLWKVAGPVVRFLMWGRNSASLEQLRDLVENDARLR